MSGLARSTYYPRPDASRAKGSAAHRPGRVGEAEKDSSLNFLQRTGDLTAQRALGLASEIGDEHQREKTERLIELLQGDKSKSSG